MSVVRKIIGLIMIVIGIGLLALTFWDAPVTPPGLELEINLFEGVKAWGIMNSVFLGIGVFFVLVGIVLGFVRSAKEVKEERSTKHNLEAQKEVNAKLETEMKTTRAQYINLQKRLKMKQDLEAKKKNKMAQTLKSGSALFQAGKYEEAIKQWEDALAAENKGYIDSIRTARDKLDKLQAPGGSKKNCPYCQAELVGFEEQCPQCLENLLSNEELVKRYLAAGLEKYIQEEYTEAISAWSKVLTLDVENIQATEYIKRAEEQLDKATAPMEEPTGPAPDPDAMNLDATAMEMNGQAAPVVEEEPMLSPEEVPATGSEPDGDLSSMDISDLDLDETEEEAINEMLNDIGVTGEVEPETTPAPELTATPIEDEELYECEVCGAVMAPDQLTCPKCGTEYDE